MDEAQRRHTAAEYRRLRETRRRLNERLMDLVSRRQVDEAARALGFWHEGTLVFDSEEDSHLLFDFAIHETGERGRNAPRRLLDDGDPGLDDDERRLLAGMVQARFGLWVVQEVLPGFGVRVRDVFGQESHDLADVGLSEKAVPELTFLGRLFDAGGFWMTTGASIPVFDEEREAVLRALDRFRSDPNWRPESPFSVTRLQAAVLSAACAARARREMGDLEIGRIEGRRVTRKPSRNAPCPCGSGKRYKGCCGKAG